MAESRGGAVGGLSPTVVVTPDLRLWEWLWLSFPTNLQRNNLVKINWHRNEKCCFFHNYEPIQYLCFDCVLAKFIWGVIQISFGLGQPNNIMHTFGAWVHNMNTIKRQLFLA
jgi:hypothetical protein